jgi:hypothetical protein
VATGGFASRTTQHTVSSGTRRAKAMADEKDRDDSPELDGVAETVARILSYAVNEPVLMQRAEEIFAPRPANIFADAVEAEKLERYVQGVFVERFGKVDGLIVLEHGQSREPERVRTYHIDIANELTRSFHVCRRATCRLHMLYIGLECLRTRPEFWIDLTEEESQLYAGALTGSFWDAVEIATIRLVSYWDRVGQLLDFVFFNIRQYERDGFPAVLARIKKNFAPTFAELDAHPSYNALVEYANSEKTSGFKWLTRRRNLAVHSTQFRPHEDKRDVLFEYEFNHYEARVIRDLALKSPKEELELIHVHLTKAAELFRGAFDLAKLGIDLIEQDVGSRRRT